MSERITQLLQQLTCSTTHVQRAPQAFDSRSFDWLNAENLDELRLFWASVQQLQATQQLDEASLNQCLQCILRDLDVRPCATLPDDVVSRVGQLYRQWKNSAQTRYRLLILLLHQGGAAGWREFAELIASDPPADPQHAVEVFLPIWRHATGPVSALFPRLLDAVQHLSVAAIVLDLANYLTRQSRLPDHPARSRASDLTWLLGQLVERLESFEETSRVQGVRDLDVARHVQETITLAVSLSHTLSLLGHREAIGKLYRMLELQHRSLRVEAAAALAKLGEATGGTALTEMATEPLVRLRVQAYAEELGIQDQISPEYRTPLALAEAELVTRLAQPDLFGVAPSSWTLVDERTWVWPGYETPQACYLFRYHYAFSQGEYTNLALVRPFAHALMPDLTVFPLADVYAVYAGWQVEHEELKQIQLDPSDPVEAAEVERRVGALTQWGCESIVPMFWGMFFGTRLLVATVSRRGQPGTVVVHEAQVDWFPQGNPVRPLGPELAYCMFVGRQLLRRFNADFDRAGRPW